MKIVTLMTAMMLASIPAEAAAASDKHAVRLFIKAVKQGQDLNAGFPGAVSPSEIASLRRVAECNALTLMKQEGGYFTVVWDCGSKGGLGMQVILEDSRIANVSTFEVERRPN